MHVEARTTTDHWDHQVRATRTRMLFSLLPVVAPVGGGFALIMLLYFHHLQPEVVTPSALSWGVSTFIIETCAGVHAFLYLRSRQRQRPAWRLRLLTFVSLAGVSWASSVWLVPLDHSPELRATLVGSVLGVSATGAFVFYAEQKVARLFFMPILLSVGVYCITLWNVRGLFGLVAVLGFLGLLWQSSQRSHRRIGEMLRLRFESEHLATLRAAALEEAQQLSRAKDMFLATMSHEMRTPLHGILGLSRMLQADANTPNARERLELIQTAGNHLLGVINDVLDLSRVKAGRLLLQSGPVDLPALAHDIVSLVQAQAHGRGKPLSIRCELDPAVPQVIQADEHRLRQVLINLMGNAVKFTDRGAITLRIRARHLKSTKRPPRIHIEVQDTGIGIPKSEQRRIFEPFHQVEAPMQHSTGTGLGLSISWQICQAMGGTLTCYSRPGKGSSFYFSLPLNGLAADETTAPANPDLHAASAAHPAAHLAPTNPGDLVGAHVLLVEDNPINTIVAKAALEQQGLRVTCLDNGRQAVDWLAHETTDLVLMDCLMPEMDGLEATRRVRQAEALRTDLRRTPIVALTASAEPSDQQACLEAGMDEVLCKPFATEALVAMLHRHLAPRAVRLSAQAQLAS